MKRKNFLSFICVAVLFVFVFLGFVQDVKAALSPFDLTATASGGSSVGVSSSWPTAVSNIMVTNQTSVNFNFNWVGHTPGVYLYQAYGESSDSSSWVQPNNPWPGQNSVWISDSNNSYNWNVSGLVPGRNYIFEVQLCNGPFVGDCEQAAQIRISIPSSSTATINVSSNISSSWTISPGGINGSGTSGSHTVSPSGSGTLYTLSPSSVPGYTASVSSSLGSGSQMYIYPGANESFTINYTPTSGGGFVDLQVGNNGSTWSDGPVYNLNPGLNFWIKWTSSGVSSCYLSISTFQSGTPQGVGLNTTLGPLNSSHSYYPAISGTTYAINCNLSGGGTTGDQITVYNDYPPPVIKVTFPFPPGHANQCLALVEWDPSYTPNACDTMWGTGAPGSCPSGWFISGWKLNLDETHTSGSSGAIWNISPAGPGPNSYYNYTQHINGISPDTVSVVPWRLDVTQEVPWRKSNILNVTLPNNPACAAPTSPPPPPTINPIALGSCGTGTLTVSWSASSGATGYTVSRSTSSGGTYTDIATVSGTSYQDTGRTIGGTYFYKVRANNSAGSSANSSAAGAVIPACPPTNLTASTSATCGGNINLSWTLANGVSYYNVYRSTSSGGSYSLIASAVSGTSYVDTAPSPSTTYYYKVQSSDQYGGSISGDSNISNAVSSAVCPPPSTPTGLNGTPGACGTAQIALSWNTSSGATSYQLFRGGSQIYSGASPSYLNTGLTPGQSYGYTVRATNSSGSSAQTSPAVNVTAPTACVNPPVVSLSASPKTITSGGSSVLTWTSSNATSCTATASPSNGQWTGSKALSGNQSITNITNTTQFTLTCTGTGGSTPSSDTVTVSGGASVDIVGRQNGGGIYTDGPITIPSGDRVDVSWTSAGVTSCTATGWWGGTYGASGSFSALGPITFNTNFGLNCTGPGGNASDTFVVNLGNNANIQVSSNVAGASWTISPGSISGSGTSGSHSVSPYSGGTTYTITPTAPSGYSLSSVTNSDGSGSSMMLFPGNTKSFSLSFSAAPPPPTPFNYSLSGQNISVVSGQSGQSIITKTYIAGTTESVNITASGMPAGVSVSYPGQGCNPTCPTTIMFNVGGGVSAGVYPITVDGLSTGTGVAKSTNINLTVTTPVVPTVTVTPNPITSGVGQQVTWTANVVGGTGCSYSWSGTEIPSSPSPTGNPYSVSYSTTGTKTTNVTVTCNEGVVSAQGTIVIALNPIFEEF